MATTPQSKSQVQVQSQSTSQSQDLIQMVISLRHSHQSAVHAMWDALSHDVVYQSRYLDLDLDPTNPVYFSEED